MMDDQLKLHIQEKYFLLIENGIKTVEGRLFTEEFKNISKKTRIIFFTTENKILECQINRISKYPNFKEMLEQEGLKNMLPGVENLSEGVAIYQSFPGYNENEFQLGAISLEIEVIKK
jgi:ASC-1-like (ASCH) protein